MRYIYLIFICLFLLITSCSHYIVNESGYVRPPKNYKFTYRKKIKALTNNEILDTMAIYSLKNSNYYRDNEEYKNSDNYIRFYADGRFKLQGGKNGIKLEDVNDIKKGVVGYYELKGNVVKLQIYTDINAGSDQLEFGIIDENKDLIILNENPRSDFWIVDSERALKKKLKKSFFSPKVYKKTKIIGITYLSPDW